MSEISTEELLALKRPKVELEVAPGRTLSVTIRPLDLAEFLELREQLPSVYQDMVADSGSSAASAPTPEQAAAGIHYLEDVVLKAVISPALSRNRDGEHLSLWDLEPLGSLVGEMKNTIILFNKIMEVSGFGSDFRITLDGANQPAAGSTAAVPAADSPQPG